MIENKCCPICGADIAFSYVRPDYDFDIIDGKIERDTNKQLWDGDLHFEFYCGFDRVHDIDTGYSCFEDERDFHMWTEVVEKEFYEKIFPEL